MIGAVLATLATSGAGAQTEAETFEAAYYLCVRQKIAQLDDQMSDAKTIGSAAYQGCSNDRIRSLQPTAGDEARARNLMRALNSSDLDRATVIVLQERAKRRR